MSMKQQAALYLAADRQEHHRRPRTGSVAHRDTPQHLDRLLAKPRRWRPLQENLPCQLTSANLGRGLQYHLDRILTHPPDRHATTSTPAWSASMPALVH